MKERVRVTFQIEGNRRKLQKETKLVETTGTNVSTIRGTFFARTGILKERNLVTLCILLSFTDTSGSPP